MDSEVFALCADRLRSRTPRPPARSTVGGRSAHDSSSASSLLTASAAAWAAAPSTFVTPTGDVSSGGGSGCRVPSADAPRTRSPTSRGSSTVLSSIGTSSPWASSQRTGESVAAASTARLASCTWPRGEPEARASSTRRSAGPAVASSSASRAPSENSSMMAAALPTPRFRATGSMSFWRSRASRVATGRPRPAAAGATTSRTGPTTRSASSEPQTSARSRSRSTPARSLSGEAASATSAASDCRVVASSLSTSPSSRASENASSCSRARSTDRRTAARAARTPMSEGTGAARSGRAWRSPASRSSGQLRSQSARLRAAGSIRTRLVAGPRRPPPREAAPVVHLARGLISGVGTTRRTSRGIRARPRWTEQRSTACGPPGCRRSASS